MICFAAGSGFGTLCELECGHDGPHEDSNGNQWLSRCYAADELCICDNTRGHGGPHICRCYHEWTVAAPSSTRELCPYSHVGERRERPG